MSRTKPQSQQGSLRIIGGEHRGRRLPILDLPGLRPTTDRVRETLFNWLSPMIPGSRCLDCFAGSGALGFEAASRGATEVMLLEDSRDAARQLTANIQRLSTPETPRGSIQVIQTDAIAWLREQPVQPFDIIFIDPPYDAKLLEPSLALVADRGWLRPGGRLYLETRVGTDLPKLPPLWKLLRDKTAGQIRYALIGIGADA